MVNVIDNESRNRNNMMPVGVKIIDDKGNTTHTAKTDLKTNYISLESKWFGSSSNNNGGNTDPDNPGHPTFGDNYYAGSLADGEITERNLEWSGIDDPTKDTIVTFNDDPGLKPFGQYTGLTILGHIQKTVMTAGTKGAVSTLDLNYDPSNTPKDGYFTTTASYPNYVKSEGLVVGKSLSIPINGVGENLNGDNIKSPEIQLAYNTDKTLTIKHIQGYVNDGNTSGATGANYDYIVDIIATFSVQSAVAQLPPSVNLFAGSASGDIVLAGLTKGFDNSMDGLQVTTDNYATGPYTLGLPGNGFGYRFDLAPFDISKITIPKEELIIGNRYKLDIKNVTTELSLETKIESNRDTWVSSKEDVYKGSMSYYLSKIDDAYVDIKENSVIDLTISFSLTSKDAKGNNSGGTYPGFTVKTTKVTTYKN
ncbi:hypothetical protein [Companilactobacillus nuruki]|uniref:Uncharacterized protein n=1 Tax=Companilactobacillus nuruki TaxID=1993540 RepID=A0A2N7AV38_9LACO|nr:hypothetical protein [Companilactobacillus nuruki]PMD71512.1 hypothetical protein CBP76_05210 [Companilactobacillus nuruki]